MSSRTNLLAYSVIATLFVLLAYPTLAWLTRTWLSNPYYSHGFLVLPIASLLAWRLWRRVVEEPRRGATWPGLLVAVGSSALVVWAMEWQNYVVSAFALVALLIGILYYIEGWARLRHWLFPLLFLVLMIPLPLVDLLSPWMESFTAHTAAALARIAGIPVVQQGGEITMPGTTLVVGAPCSGLRSLVAMLTVGIGWVYVVRGRLWAKAVMIAAIVPLAALSNVLRITILVMVAAHFGEEAAMTYYHGWSSPVLFLTALGLLLILGRLLGCYQVRDDIF